MLGLFKKKKELDKDAVALFVRMSSEEASASDTADLISWAETEPEKLDDVQLLADVWHETGEMEVDRSIFFGGETKAVSLSWWQQAWETFTDGWRYPVAATAMAAMVLAVVTVVGVTPPQTDNVSYATLRGNTQAVELVDGTDLHLNGMSRVEVAYSEDERRVNMLEGEVYFDVSPDKERAFIVDVAGVEVRAVGTAFDIEAGHNAVTVIVTEGIVSIGQGSNKQQYSAGNKVVVPLEADEEGFRVTKLVLSDFEDAVTWRSGVLNFSGETLSVAIERINRQSAKPIVLVDQSLSDLQIFGSFRKGNIGSFISAIEALYPVRVVESHYRVALYNRNKRGNTERTRDDHT